MARRYGSFTPARRAALRRAQLASAAKRRGRRRLTPRQRKIIKYGAVGTGATVGILAARHYASGSYTSFQTYSTGSQLNRMVQTARKTNAASAGGRLYVTPGYQKRKFKVRAYKERPFPDPVWHKGGPTLYGVKASTKNRSFTAGYHHMSVASGRKTRSNVRQTVEPTPRQSYRSYKSRKWAKDRAFRQDRRGMKMAMRKTIRGL